MSTWDEKDPSASPCVPGTDARQVERAVPSGWTSDPRSVTTGIKGVGQPRRDATKTHATAPHAATVLATNLASARTGTGPDLRSTVSMLVAGTASLDRVRKGFGCRMSLWPWLRTGQFRCSAGRSSGPKNLPRITVGTGYGGAAGRRAGVWVVVRSREPLRIAGEWSAGSDIASEWIPVTARPCPSRLA